MSSKTGADYSLPKRKSLMTRKNAPYLFLTPMIILFAVFMIYPVIKSLILSFQDFTDGQYIFCGIQNYVTMFKDPIFWKSLKNTFIYLAVQVPGHGSALTGTRSYGGTGFLKVPLRIPYEYLPAVSNSISSICNCV